MKSKKQKMSLVWAGVSVCVFTGCSAVKEMTSAPKEETPQSRSIANAPGVAALKWEETPASDFEKPQTLASSKVLPRQLLAGPRFKVRPTAEADGFMYYFTADTNYGQLEAYGIEELKQRLAELPGVASLATRGTGKTVVKGTVSSVVGSVQSTAHLALNPVTTLQAAPGALGSAFADATSTVGITIDPETKEEATAHDSDRSLTKKAGAFASDFGDDILGYSEAKRQAAVRAKLNPYSANPLVQRELIRVARAETGGSLAAMAIPLPTVVDILATTNDLVWKMDERSIIASSFKTLIRLGARQDEVERFLKSEFFTRTEAAEFTKTVAYFTSGNSVANAVKAASDIKSRGGALATLSGLKMLQEYSAANGKRLVLTDRYGLLAGNLGTSTVILPVAVDNLMWTEPGAKFLTNVDRRAHTGSNGTTVTLLYRGEVSSTTRANLERMGWVLKKG